MQPSLYVSIPARLLATRSASRGEDSPQCRIIRSWRQAGFVPVSINTVAEHERFPGFRDALTAADVESVVVPQQDRGVLCSIRALLAAIAAHAPGGPVAITNADIALAGGRALATAVETLAASRFLLGQRTDVADGPPAGFAGDPGAGTVNFHGFDFFAFDSAAIASAASFLAEDLGLGQPFWDHFLPLALMAAGLRPALVDPGCMLHATHPVQWSVRAYCDLGLAGSRHLAARLAADPAAARACGWLPTFAGCLEPEFGVNRLDRLSRRLIRSGWAPRTLVLRKIGPLAAANVTYLFYAAALAGRDGFQAITSAAETAAYDQVRYLVRACRPGDVFRQEWRSDGAAIASSDSRAPVDERE